MVTRRLLSSGVASFDRWGGWHIHIFMFTTVKQSILKEINNAEEDTHMLSSGCLRHRL